jgi:hypothetical protein
MNELPYFYFIVPADPQPWPYFAEIPYAAWPDEAMDYNSDGNCEHVVDRNWSYLDVMNWETHENLLVCNAKILYGESGAKMRLLSEQNLGWGDDLLSLSHPARLVLYLLDNLPAEYRKEGNAVISSFRCATPVLTAAVACLFMRRFQSKVVWDAQSAQAISDSELSARYLNDFPMGASIQLADEAARLFGEAEAKYQGRAGKSGDWWKTLAQIRAFIERPMPGMP